MADGADAATGRGVLRSGARWRRVGGDEVVDRLVIEHDDTVVGRAESRVLAELPTAAGVPRLLAAEVADGGVRLEVEAPTATSADAVEYRFDPEATVRLLAANLRRVHETPPPAGWAPLGVGVAVDVARRAVESGLHRQPHDGAYGHLSGARLLSILVEGADHAAEVGDDPVLCHGDPGTASARLHRSTPAGWLGWDRATVADRHLDLAIAARAVATSIGPMVVPLFFEAYGVDRPDPRLLEWYALLDALR